VKAPDVSLAIAVSGFDYHLVKPIEFQSLEAVLREIRP
jgi:hypothetical protein